MKYDKMVERNRKDAAQKKERALSAIKKLLLDKQPVSVGVLSQKTGLSRSFFYQNVEVRGAVFDAKAKQKDLRHNRTAAEIFDKAMSAQLEQLGRQLDKERAKRCTLEKENEKLQKALKRKNLNVLRSL